MGSFSLFHWVIFGVIVFLIFKAVKPKEQRIMICPNCGSHGAPAVRVRGSIWIEIILWCMLILPGLIYSIWRLSTKEPVCPLCDHRGVIPITSPKGMELAAKFSPK